MAIRAKITPSVLRWALSRADLSEDGLASKLGTKAERIRTWLDGDAQPTFNQAQRLAKAAYIPFGFLFLPEPPEEELPLPDLRTVRNKAIRESSPELQDVIKQVLRKQAWYVDYLRDHDHSELEFVGSCSINDEVNTVVEKIKNNLGVSRPSSGNWQDYHRDLVQAAERIGIMVMRAGIVGSNTHRKLSVKEFRGFAIADKLAPVVFINSSDAPAARLFTLVHELAHIWLGESGISSASTGEGKKEEVFCNEVAGEFLVPKNELMNYWDEREGWQTNVSLLVARFHVSKLVLARRALEAGLVEHDEYRNFYATEMQAFKDSDSSGGSFYRNAGARNSRQFSVAVVTEALRGGILLRDAGALLNIPPNKIKQYAGELQL
ncbi:ImmA/IrrE family metallo-endopeptidase [Halomonas alkalisoli]|uniref:ImmA/IrrE family metallo-endopeptidase n=1 Tax=Halomonas alkalisoli TaxID=2907158 RepID=UPI001F41D605|nr:ImmA/IrrE family metallo-endopeptidase [Halomonas alkalisoli]MCE9684467.1 ImmA/IrrE family metallo-endopeptidase [Halomonas alkalisoli]